MKAKFLKLRKTIYNIILIRDLRAIIEELAVLKKRLDSLKLKIDLALGSNREPWWTSYKRLKYSRKD